MNEDRGHLRRPSGEMNMVYILSVIRLHRWVDRYSFVRTKVQTFQIVNYLSIELVLSKLEKEFNTIYSSLSHAKTSTFWLALNLSFLTL